MVVAICRYWPAARLDANEDDGEDSTRGSDGQVGWSGVDVGEGTSAVALQDGQQGGSGVDGYSGQHGWSWFENWDGTGCSYGQIS